VIETQGGASEFRSFDERTKPVWTNGETAGERLTAREPRSSEQHSPLRQTDHGTELSPVGTTQPGLFLNGVKHMATASWFSKMLGTNLRVDSLDTVLLLQLKDLYNAETQLMTALPKMAAAAHSTELRQAFETHLEETRGQKARLEQVFRMLGQQPEGETCEAMQGLVTEGDEVIALEGDPDVKDAALIASAQRVEHYEIAGYGCARSFALRIGRPDIASLLQETLDEEGNADKILTQIAESQVNVEAAQAVGT
jgi:ferritin-like metal-binding protein YciE